MINHRHRRHHRPWRPPVCCNAVSLSGDVCLCWWSLGGSTSGTRRSTAVMDSQRRPAWLHQSSAHVPCTQHHSTRSLSWLMHDDIKVILVQVSSTHSPRPCVSLSKAPHNSPIDSDYSTTIQRLFQRLRDD